MKQQNRNPKHHTATFDYDALLIAYDVWTTNANDKIDTILFLGTGQVGKLPRWIAAHCPPQTAVIQGAPHWHAKPDGSDIPTYMYAFTAAAFQEVAATFSVADAHIIADSQAVPGVARLVTTLQHQKNISRVTFIQPLGFTANVYKGTDQERMARFKQRITKNLRKQTTELITDRRARHNTRILSRILNLRNPEAFAQYNSGLKHDSLPDLVELANMRIPITIISGENDALFPPDEIRQNFIKYKLPIHVRVIPNVAHTTLASRQGRKLLASALRTNTPKSNMPETI